jgi:hypothetical protein
MTKNRLLWGLCCVTFFCPFALTQQTYTQGPIWRIELIRVKPGQMDAYLSFLQVITKPLLEEEKRQHLIVDYKCFLKQTKSGLEDWDVELAVEYKDYASLDNITPKHDTIRDQIVEGKEGAQALINKTRDTREIISTELLEEIELK